MYYPHLMTDAVDIAGLPATIAMLPYARGMDEAFPEGFGLHLQTDPREWEALLASFILERRTALKCTLGRFGFATLPVTAQVNFQKVTEHCFGLNGMSTCNARGRAIDWHQDGTRMSMIVILQALPKESGGSTILPPTGVTSPAAVIAVLPPALDGAEQLLGTLSQNIIKQDAAFLRIALRNIRKKIVWKPPPLWEEISDDFITIFRSAEGHMRGPIGGINRRLREMDALYAHEWTVPLRILILGNRRVLHAHIERPTPDAGKMQRFILNG